MENPVDTLFCALQLTSDVDADRSAQPDNRGIDVKPGWRNRETEMPERWGRSGGRRRGRGSRRPGGDARPLVRGTAGSKCGDNRKRSDPP